MVLQYMIRSAPDAVGLMVLQYMIRYPPDAVGLMVFQEIIRSAPDAVGLKPSARGSEAHLRGLDRIHCWKTISPRRGEAKPAFVG